MATNYLPRYTGFPNGVPAQVRAGGSVDKLFGLGQLINDNEGNFYRYIRANEAISAGDALTALAQVAWDSGILVDGAVSSGKKIHVDTVTTAVAAGFYQDRWIKQAAAASKGYSYRIAGHDALAASGEGDIFVEPEIGETFADDAALLIQAPWLMEQIDATTERIMGFACTDIASGSYGFAQVGGTVPAAKVGHSTSAAIVLNEPLNPVGSGNAGAIQGVAAGTPNEAEIMTLLNNVIALEAVNANTTGFIRVYIKGIL